MMLRHDAELQARRRVEDALRAAIDRFRLQQDLTTLPSQRAQVSDALLRELAAEAVTATLYGLTRADESPPGG